MGGQGGDDREEMISRRGLITGLAGLICAPAIVRAGSLMPVKVMAWGSRTLGIPGDWLSKPDILGFPGFREGEWVLTTGVDEYSMVMAEWIEFRDGLPTGRMLMATCLEAREFI